MIFVEQLSYLDRKPRTRDWQTGDGLNNSTLKRLNDLTLKRLIPSSLRKNYDPTLRMLMVDV
jgi:hypothetical protein